MRRRTIALAFAGAAAVSAATIAATIGAAVATALAEASADRTERAYTAMAKAFFTMPDPDRAAGHRPGLTLIRGGPPA